MPKDIFTRATPNNISELAGNCSLISKLLEHIRNSNKSILISGPVGCGKTKTLELILKDTGIEGLWFDCSEIKEQIDKICSKSSSISGQKKVFIIDNVDSFPSEISKKLLKKIKESENIIIIVCNDPYPLKEFSYYCESYKFIRPSVVQIRNFMFLKKIFKKDKITEEQIESLNDLISSVNNDIRALINKLAYNEISEKDSTINNVFDATAIMFSNKESIDRKFNAYYYDSFIIPSMIHENIKCQGSDIKSLKDYSHSMNCFTESDFNSITDWSLSNYKCCSLISATKRFKPSYPMNFPKSIGKESTMRSFKIKLSDININRLEFPYIMQILSGLINEQEYEKAKNMLSNYKMSKESFYDLQKYHLFEEMLKVDTKTKSAFTRYINKSVKKPTLIDKMNKLTIKQ